ncbi:UvrD-helicase domain-containing protein [Sneathiella sp.]|jgi:DNA helicase-2/ATP-dependent DNA helicase PcrA|uniref:UvrD-helicase domain-containing protein n=1 Tax=Sneathiella sp. TaxID=1964365 RepID=UPI0039E29FDD
MKKDLLPTEADNKIQECLAQPLSFSVVAGAGSGKTTSLVLALDFVRGQFGSKLRQQGQRVVCITYTNRAVDVISSRLGFDDLFFVKTLHTFLWGEIHRFTREIREALKEDIIPRQIAKAEEKDNGGASQTALKARAKAERLKADLNALENVEAFKYDDAAVSNYAQGQLSHDDIVSVAAYIIINKPIFQRILGQKYPYFFVDEAQDTFEQVVTALNKVCAKDGLPIVGYFGDPMQQIYDQGTGGFGGPPGSVEITKQENFRCSVKVINLLNAFRKDVRQIPAGNNKDIEGSVFLTLIQAQEPAGPRKRYTDEQLEQSLQKFDQAVQDWGWAEGTEVKKLFLVRQMIARRLGFTNIHKLFTGAYASSKAQEDYESGDHFLLKPFVKTICPIVRHQRQEDYRSLIDVLRRTSPAFDVRGQNSEKSLKAMMTLSKELAEELAAIWADGSLKEILVFCNEHGLFKPAERLISHLERAPRDEEYDPDLHTEEKSDWLCDTFFEMKSSELQNYCDFVEDNTLFSTQHGVKGEEYENVLVVFDDVEAAWNQYSFTKTLTPGVSGVGTDGQLNRTSKLAYVCFSRAETNLRIVLFTPSPEAAKNELVANGFLSEDQINILD